MRIALTGNIASGKSAVLEFMKEKGINVLDTDEVAHELLTVNNKPLFDAFKDYDVFENGEFSRLKLGKLVFADGRLRKKLEAIMHPQIAEKIKNFDGVVAIPLLFEAKMENLFDKIIMVYADDEKRLQRLMKRNDLTREEAMKRMNSQMSQDEKLPMCDLVLYNNGTIDELTQAVAKLMNLNFDRQ